MYDSLFNLRVFASGRTLWVGGTKAATLTPDANFNCAFTVCDSIQSIKDLFFLCMASAGVGFRILDSDVAKFPHLRNDLTYEHRPYIKKPKIERQDKTILEWIDESRGEVAIVVGDSKEGWTQACGYFFELHTEQYPMVKKITLIYDNCRPKGERLKTFGGWSSGHETLQVMFEKLILIISNHPTGVMEADNLLDFNNIIGENINSGGVRRMAETGIGSPSNPKFVGAKTNINYSDPNDPLRHRRASNNSCWHETRPSLADLGDLTREGRSRNLPFEKYGIFDHIYRRGEPGFINVLAALMRRADFEGFNPCFEILLRRNGVCNLSSVVLSACVKKDRFGNYYIDWQMLESMLRLAARIGCRMTNVTMTLPHWDIVQKTDRLVGVSLTGFMDLCNLIDMHPLSSESRSFLQKCRAIVNEEVDRYAFKMRIPRPRLACTIKPEGSQSKMPGCSSGAGQWPYPEEEFVEQRIRISQSDVLVGVMEQLGHPVELDVTDSNTSVVSFPVRRTPSKFKLNAIEQLELYYLFQENYTDHNTSYTVYVGEDEWDGIVKHVYSNWDRMIACSFFSASDKTSYPQMPYEPISQARYLELVSRIRPFDYSLLQAVEQNDGATEIVDAECANGVCPTR
jgi:ribonucleoside-diphosphate reductase alpha chain/ribonucleoside-triphosphate reductase